MRLLAGYLSPLGGPWTGRWINHKVCDTWPVWLTVTFPASERHRPLTGTKLYCLMTEAHSSCQIKPLRNGPNTRLEPATYKSQLRCPTDSATCKLTCSSGQNLNIFHLVERKDLPSVLWIPPQNISGTMNGHRPTAGRPTYQQWHGYKLYPSHLLFNLFLLLVSTTHFENLYSPSKHGRQQTISNTNEIKQL